MAQEKGVELGQEVGYAVRFEERTSRRTKIKYLTGRAGRGVSQCKYLRGSV